jgi:hypothetical protein
VIAPLLGAFVLCLSFVLVLPSVRLRRTLFPVTSFSFLFLFFFFFFFFFFSFFVLELGLLYPRPRFGVSITLFRASSSSVSFLLVDTRRAAVTSLCVNTTRDGDWDHQTRYPNKANKEARTPLSW